MGLMELLGITSSSNAKGEDRGLMFSELARELEGQGTAEIKKITDYAGLLGKVAAADMDISDDELEGIRRLLTDILKLTESKTGLILQLIANHRVQLFSIEDHIYARLVNEVCTQEEKCHLLTALFSVAAADQSISQEEDAAIWTAAKSLKLSHKDFISSRKQFTKYLDVLKGS